MANVAWEAFLPMILVQAPGVSQPLAEASVRDAAIEFCKRSLAWVHHMDALPIVAGVADYDLDVPDGAVAIQPLDVWADGEPLDPAAPRELTALYGEWRAETGTPLYYLHEVLDGAVRQLTLAPKPIATVSNGLTARLALRPTKTSTEIDEAIYEEYGTVIANQALGRLLLMPKRPWSDAEHGVALLREFSSQCSAAQLRAARGGTRAPLRSRTVHGVI